ncbi:MAG: EAL domain-containing protein [Betaproteobacteria bacterium]|nr:EAL domain-containing protein [Betaproteobacteria bacterium]
MPRLFERLRGGSLAHKILLINGLVVLICGLLALWLMLSNQHRLARAQWLSSAHLTTSVVAQGLSDALAAKRPTEVRALLNSLLVRPQVRGAAVFGAHGNLLFSSGQGLEFPQTRSVQGQEAVMSDLLEAHASLTTNGRNLGTLVIRADEYGLYRAVIDDAYPLLVMAGSGLVMLMLMIWMLIPMAMRRLGQLADVMGAVTRDANYDVRAPVKGTDETAQLARAFNSMLDQIQIREGKLREELSERRKAQQQTAYVANHDFVTGLPNRRFFTEAIGHSLEKIKQGGENIGVVIVDIDNFKRINDSFGHQAGDRILAEVGSRLRQKLRSADLVCRLGGNQFAVLLGSAASAPQATDLGERALQAILKPFVLEGREVELGASAGIALALKDSTPEELLRNAEAALHDAKASGKGSVRLFRPYMIDRVKQRLSLEQALKTALEQETFTLHYQPQVGAKTQKLLGVEALIRWRHPKLGEIPPAQFIPLAEETGIIVPLGAWVLRQACADAHAWQSQGLSGVGVAVNVSARQFHEPGFVETVLATLRQTRLNGSLLELELTESMLLDRNGLHIAELAALREQGVSFAIDDFGTGYSSLSVLKHFSLQRLKIDRGFVKNIPYESDDVAIASAVIAMGHKMGLEVVAEGVETQSQYEYLKDQACDRIQGYLFSKPLPLEELLAKYAVRGAEPEHQGEQREPKLVFSR